MPDLNLLPGPELQAMHTRLFHSKIGRALQAKVSAAPWGWRPAKNSCLASVGTQELKPLGLSESGNQGWWPPTPGHQVCVKGPFRKTLEPQSPGAGQKEGVKMAPTGGRRRGSLEMAPASTVCGGL